LPADAPVGAGFAKYAGYDDPVIEINLTPNRPDCAGVHGIARDLAAAGLGTLRAPNTMPVPATAPSPIKITLDFPAGNKACPFFVGRVIRNIQNRPSPAWLQQRLQAIGLRPISALVDITNFMTFDMMRPLHVFDAKKLTGNLWLRAAKGGEKLSALNGKDYTLEPGMTVIGDDSGVISLGGIMGGVTTSCDENTTDVVIESACFDPIRTARTGRALQINSDARYRFERGIDPAFTVPGMEMATRLFLELCGTPNSIVHQVEIAGQVPSTNRTITLDTAKTARYTGVEVSPEAQEKILKSLGFTVKSEGKILKVVPPSWRPDIDGAADLVEEIVRVKGYEHIVATSLPRPQTAVTAAIDLQDQRAHAARRALASQVIRMASTAILCPP